MKYLRRVNYQLYGAGQWKWKEDGHFHQWGLTYDEFENGAVGATMAIVEDDEGQVHLVHPERLQFIDPHKNLDEFFEQNIKPVPEGNPTQ